ncbi:ParB/RepB/Spo0J family partition protein [Streptomyces uncialis]|uniref:ParB/RepB/Spo0J family partition protein n=1 Tax=Streptomyces uncialis TaxID=1048205 RepID=UPI00378BC7D6
MKKSDSLGGSATFDAVTQPMSSRAASFARFTGQDTTPATPTPDGAPASPRVPVDHLAHNPYNPREDLRSVEEIADSLTSRGVIQPLAVVTRQAFLTAHPGHEEKIGTAQYIVVDGNRRLAGARLAGLEDVPIHLDDSLADDADTLLEAALTAAVQHENLDPLDEAKALQRLITVHGSQRAVARSLGKSSGWVTQRIALLKLTPELQQAVEKKQLPVEIGRQVGQLPQQQQHTAAKKALDDRAEKKQSKRTRTDRSAEKGAHAVSTPHPAANSPEATTSTPHPETAPSKNPAEPAPGESGWVDGLRRVTKMPWHDGDKVADLVFQKMHPSQLEVLLNRLLANQPATGITEQ